MSQLIMPLIFGVIYATAFLREGGQPDEAGKAPTWLIKNLQLYGNVGISLFVSWSLLSRLASMGFSQEGKSYWLLKTAPVKARELLSAKFLVAYLPALGMGWGFLLIISLLLGITPSTLLFSLAVTALCIAGTAGLNLAFGVWGANFEWEDPRKMVNGTVGCLGMLASMLYLGLSLLLFFGPPVVLLLLRAPNALGQIVGLALGGIFSLTGTVLPLWLVRKRVAHLGEG